MFEQEAIAPMCLGNSLLLCVFILRPDLNVQLLEGTSGQDVAALFQYSWNICSCFLLSIARQNINVYLSKRTVGQGGHIVPVYLRYSVLPSMSI